MGYKPLRKCTPPFIAEAVRIKKIIFTDLHFDPNEPPIHLCFVIQLCESSARDTVPFGFIVLKIDSYQFLYPHIQTWATLSKTADILLVRKEGNEVVFLNEFCHRKNTALSFRAPVGWGDLLAAMAVKDKTGIVEGVDYRGVSVLALVGTIPDSTWFLVSKIDLDEANPFIKERTWFGVIIVALLIAFTGSGTCHRAQKGRGGA